MSRHAHSPPADRRVTSLTGVVKLVFCSTPTFSAGKLRTDDGDLVHFAGEVRVRLAERVVLSGRYERSPKYGWQFRAKSLVHDLDLDVEGLTNYLADHPDIAGIGPVRARKIARAFGHRFDTALESTPQQIADVAGVALDVILDLREVWRRTAAVNAAMTWLAAYGLTHHQVTTLVEEYGNNIVPLLRDDPYVVAGAVRGFGFKRIDVVARKLGTPKDHLSRLKAGVMHCVTQHVDDGDCWVEYEQLIEEANALLVLDTLDSRALIERALDLLIAEKKLACTSIGGRFLVARARLYEMERALARWLGGGSAPNPLIRDLARIEHILRQVAGDLNESQEQALRMALGSRQCVIAGAAGSGKTYVIAALTRVYQALGRKVVLAAPTGKAAKRLEQVVLREAVTIHRLLEFNGRTFRRGRREPLECDVVIVDEVSMVDVPLAWQLLDALPRNAALVLVGDHNQLPPVGPGNLLRDLIERRPVPVHVLRDVVRQAGVLRANSLAVLDGEVRPSAEKGPDGRRPWYLVDQFSDALAAQRFVLELFDRVLAERLRFDLLRDVQVLSPQRKGPLGVNTLNVLLQRLLQKKLFGVEAPVVAEGRRPELLCGDKVIQTRNNYRLGVMNGSIGHVLEVVEEGKEKGDLVVLFENGVVRVRADNGDAADLRHAYAITIHRCVAGDTLVATDRGLRRIRDLAAGVAPGTFRRAEHRVAGRSGWATTDQVFAGGREPTLRITTRCGYALEASHRHPVLVATAQGEQVWRRAPDLQVGDVLVLRRGVGAGAPHLALDGFEPSPRPFRIGHVPPVMDSELAWFLGVLVGDGNQTDMNDGRVEVVKGDREFILRVAIASVRLFGARPRVRHLPGRSSVYFHGRLIREFLAWAGVGFERAGEKHVPWCVLEGPLEVQRAFLRGLFDTDGGVHRRVHLTTTSTRLAFEVQLLLLNNGIVSSRSLMRAAIPERGWAAAHRLDVMGDNIRRFRDAVAFSHPRKSRRLLALRTEDEPAHGGKSNCGALPHGRAIATQLRDELRQRGGRNYPEAESVGCLLSRVARGSCQLNDQHAKLIRAAVPRLEETGPAGAEIAAVVRDGLFFDPVVRIEAGEAEVFDLHIPEGHAFVGNGLINHNSQGSEFPCVVALVHKSHSYMHHRNLFYTAVTRAQEVAVIVGDRWGQRHCAEKEQVERRKTFLSILDFEAEDEDLADELPDDLLGLPLHEARAL